MKKQKLLISAITLVFAVIAVVSSTYAWFTMNSVNTVSNLDFTATTGEGLYMSLTGEDGTWKTELKEEDFAKTGVPTAKYFDGQAHLSPVTYKYDSVEGFTKYAKTGTPISANADKDYIVFTIKFRSATATSVKVTDLSVTSPAYTETFKLETTPADVAVGEFWAQYNDPANGVVLNTTLANAARVMISGARTQVFDPNPTAQYGGIADSYDNSLSHQYITKVSSSTAGVIQQNYTWGNIFKDYAAALSNEYMVELTQKGSTVDGEFVLSNPNDAWYYGELTFTLWIEGFDNDCFDILLGQSLAINFKFESGTPTSHQ